MGGPGCKALRTWRATVPAPECETRCAGRAEHHVLCRVSPEPQVGVPHECPVTVTAAPTASYWSFLVTHIWGSEFPCSRLGGYPNTCCSKSVPLKHLPFLNGEQRGGENSTQDRVLQTMPRAGSWCGSRELSRLIFNSLSVLPWDVFNKACSLCIHLSLASVSLCVFQNCCQSPTS